jgi:hypothetical protein
MFAQCSVYNPSNKWFGLFSPIENIRNNGLWLVNELYKEILSIHDINEINNLINVKNDILLKQEILESDRYKINYIEGNKSINTINIIWINIIKPTKKCTIHTSLSCPYVLSIEETNRKGIGNLKIDGGWISFNNYIESIEVDGEPYHSSMEQKKYDKERDLVLSKNGWLTMRFTAKDVYYKGEIIANQIADSFLTSVGS